MLHGIYFTITGIINAETMTVTNAVHNNGYGTATELKATINGLYIR